VVNLFRVLGLLLGVVLFSGCQRATRFDRLPGTAFPETRHFQHLKVELIDTLPSPSHLIILVQRYGFLSLREGISMPRFRKWLNQLQYGSPGPLTSAVQQDLRPRKVRWFENEIIPLGLPTGQEVQQLGFLDSFSVQGRYRQYFMVKQTQRSSEGLEPFASQRVSYHCYSFRENRTVLLEHIFHTESWSTLQRLLTHQYKALNPNLSARVMVPTTENFYFSDSGIIFGYNPNEIASNQPERVELLLPWAWVYHLLREQPIIAWQDRLPNGPATVG
jgi:hypothetical protein